MTITNFKRSGRGVAYIVALSGMAWAMGCSDDDTKPNADSGGSAGKGGSVGSAGTAGKASGGSASGGTAGKGGSSAGEGGTGMAGEAGAGDAGASGEGGAGGAGPEPLAPITKGVFSLIPEVNEIRGLAFSADGTKIYGSGHVNGDDRMLAIVRFNLDGSLDESFDTDGVLVTNVATIDGDNGHPGDEQSLGIVELPGGDLVVQANVSDGNGGQLIEDIFIDDATLQDPAEDDVARPDGVDVVLLRFTSAGEPVDTFGDNGVAKIDFGWAAPDDATWPAPTYTSDPAVGNNARFSGPGYPTDQGWGLSVDETGTKLVVFGFGPSPKVPSGTQRTDNDRYVAKVLATTGEPDPDFAGGKPYTFFMPGALGDNARRGIVEPDGKIVAGGYTNPGAGWGNHVVVVRLNSNGTPDTSFGFGTGPLGGAVANPFRLDGGGAECYALGKQSNDMYVTVGYGSATGTGILSSYGYSSTTGPDALLFRLGATAYDTSWGIDGTVAIQSEDLALASTEDRGRDLVVLPDDRIVAVGRFGVSPAIFVLNPDGDMATDQVADGRFIYDALVDPNDATVATSHFYRVVLSPDKKTIVTTTNNHVSGVLLAMLNVGD